MEENQHGLQVGKTLLRVAQLLTSIIALGCAGSIAGSYSNGGIGLTVFTSLTSLVICLIFLLPVAFKSQRAAYASRHAIIADIILNAAWTVFWLACAACLSEGRWACALILTKSGDGTSKNACNMWRATEAFAYLALFAWVGYTVLTVTKMWHEFKERRGGNAPTKADEEHGEGSEGSSRAKGTSVKSSVA